MFMFNFNEMAYNGKFENENGKHNKIVYDRK